ncbi:hypothetical protein D1872_333540 [compost metagenome]
MIAYVGKQDQNRSAPAHVLGILQIIAVMLIAGQGAVVLKIPKFACSFKDHVPRLLADARFAGKRA